jgi:hypothetical protein
MIIFTNAQPHKTVEKSFRSDPFDVVANRAYHMEDIDDVFKNTPSSVLLSMVRSNDEGEFSYAPTDDWFTVLSDGTLMTFTTKSIDLDNSIISTPYCVTDLDSIDFDLDDWGDIERVLVEQDARWGAGSVLALTEDEARMHESDSVAEIQQILDRMLR